MEKYNCLPTKDMQNTFIKMANDKMKHDTIIGAVLEAYSPFEEALAAVQTPLKGAKKEDLSCKMSGAEFTPLSQSEPKGDLEQGRS